MQVCVCVTGFFFMPEWDHSQTSPDDLPVMSEIFHSISRGHGGSFPSHANEATGKSCKGSQTCDPVPAKVNRCTWALASAAGGLPRTLLLYHTPQVRYVLPFLCSIAVGVQKWSRVFNTAWQQSHHPGLQCSVTSEQRFSVQRSRLHCKNTTSRTFDRSLNR